MDNGDLVGVMVAVDHIASDEPAYCAAYEDIGGEVLAGEDTRQADAGGKAVGGDLRERAFVLGSDDGGGGPGDDVWFEGNEELNPTPVWKSAGQDVDRIE